MSLARNSSVRRYGWIGAAALLGSGCFSYVPAEMGSVAPGEDVRAFLAMDQVAAGLAGLSNQPNSSVAGRLMREDGEQVVLRVPVAVQPFGSMSGPIGQDLIIPSRQIVQLERREFNRARTGVAVAGGVVAVVVAFLSFRKGTPINPELPTTPIEDGLRGAW